MTQMYKLASEFKNLSTYLSDMIESPASDDDFSLVKAALDELKLEIEAKASNIGMLIKNLEVTADAIKSAEIEMSKRRKRIEAKAAELREYLKFQLEMSNTLKIETPFVRISIKKNPPSIIIEDEESVPNEYFKIPTPTRVIDKKMLTDDLKAGVIIDGVKLSNSTRIDIR